MQMYHAGPFWPSSQSLLVYWAREETHSVRLRHSYVLSADRLDQWSVAEATPQNVQSVVAGMGCSIQWAWSTTSAPPPSPGGSVESQPQLIILALNDKRSNLFWFLNNILYYNCIESVCVALWNFSIPTSEIHNSTSTLVFPDSKILTLLFFVCSLDLFVI